MKDNEHFVSPIGKQVRLGKAAAAGRDAFFAALREQFHFSEQADQALFEPEEAAALERALLSAAEEWYQRNLIPVLIGYDYPR